MQRIAATANSNDYVLRAEIELDNSLLHIEGEVLEHFRASSLDSQGRLLLRGVIATVAGPDANGDFQFRINGPDRRAPILLPVEAERAAEAESFAASVRYAASGTSAFEDAAA